MFFLPSRDDNITSGNIDIKEYTLDELSDNEIRVFLEDSPLYTWHEYSYQNKRANLWIRGIDEYCEVCKQVRTFQNPNISGGGAGMQPTYLQSGKYQFLYRCVTCRKQTHEYMIENKVCEDTVSMQKYGQLPRKKLSRDKHLNKFFKEDAEYYEKAIMCLSNGYGIAAFAYFRRIIESNIIKLLDLMIFDLDSTSPSDVRIAAIEKLKKEHPMSDKIKIANEAVPEYLKPNGINPLGRIYGSLSEGIHSLTDTECLEKASTIQFCLKFMVIELASRKKNRDDFENTASKI